MRRNHKKHHTNQTRHRDEQLAINYVGHCSCGWMSTVQPTEDAAENEATNHVVAVTPALEVA